MSGPKILVAEDSKVIRAVLRQYLEEQAYTVIEAEDGDAALRACQADAPDAVLLDIEMPGLDGYEVLAALKADPDLADLPVVFLTGRTSTEDVVEGLRLGAHDYLKKPFEASELIARVSAAVRVKRLQDELRARNIELDLLSRTDVLTGLPNRRQVEERLLELVSISHRHHDTFSVLMIDIDHFKNVNDTVGHAGGDAVLREFAARLQRTVRDEDIAGRWGGEEFLVLLPLTKLAGAAEFGERLRAAIASDPFVLPDGSMLSISMSGGCAESQGEGPEDLVRRADDALYTAKETGRNRVVAAGSVLEAAQ